MSEQHVKRRLI